MGGLPGVPTTSLGGCGEGDRDGPPGWPRRRPPAAAAWQGGLDPPASAASPETSPSHRPETPPLPLSQHTSAPNTSVLLARGGDNTETLLETHIAQAVRTVDNCGSVAMALRPTLVSFLRALSPPECSSLSEGHFFDLMAHPNIDSSPLRGLRPFPILEYPSTRGADGSDAAVPSHRICEGCAVSEAPSLLSVGPPLGRMRCFRMQIPPTIPTGSHFCMNPPAVPLLIINTTCRPLALVHVCADCVSLCPIA